jgi:glycosyltransferase 2 family protein
VSFEDEAGASLHPGSIRQGIGRALKILISAGLLVYLFWQIDLQETVGAIVRANPWWLLAAFIVFELSFVLRALRWKALIRGWGANVPIKDLVVWYLVGSFFNSVLPTGFGGDVLRVYELSRQVNDPVLAANSVVVDRYLGLMVLLGMGLLALPLGAGAVSQQVILTLAGLFVAGLAGGVLVLNQRWWRLASQRIPIVGRLLAGKLSGLSDTASRYSARSLAEATLMSFVFNLSLIAFNVLLGMALDMHVSLRYFFIFIPITSAVLMLPSVGGLGVREVSYATLFPMVGVSEPVAVSLSLLVYVNTLATGLIGGVIYLLSGARGYWKRKAS